MEKNMSDAIKRREFLKATVAFAGAIQAMREQMPDNLMVTTRIS